MKKILLLFLLTAFLNANTTNILLTLSSNKINAKTINNTIVIETDKKENTDLIQFINYILSIIEPVYNGYNIELHSFNAGTFYLDASLIIKYYNVAITDRAGTLNIDAMRVKK